MGDTRTGWDRRQHPRAHFNRIVAFQNDGRVFTANVEDISESGLSLEAPWLDPDQPEVTVELPLRGRFGAIERCSITGDIVSRRGSSVSIAFRRLLPKHKLQLRDFVWRARPRY